MKQHISKEQAKTDPKTFCKVMTYLGYAREYFDGEIENFRNSDVEIVTIGKMIEILEGKDEFSEIVRLEEGNMPYIVHLKSGYIFYSDNLCDALWQAVLAIL